MIGDSITRQGDWAALLGREEVVNWGHPGYTTGQIAWTFKDLVALHPGLQVVFLSGGTNDLLLGVPVERMYQNQRDAVGYWRDRGVVPVLQGDHEDVALEVRGLGPEVVHHPAELLLDGEHPWGQQPLQAERGALLGREGGALVLPRVLEQVQPPLARRAGTH